jgi:prevent-host-death family protein
MQTVNIHEARTHPSRLVKQAAEGESFLIAKAGKPLVKVTALDAPSAQQARRLRFLAGEITVPDDFDRMDSEEMHTCSGQPRALLDDPHNELLFSAASF